MLEHEPLQIEKGVRLANELCDLLEHNISRVVLDEGQAFELASLVERCKQSAETRLRNEVVDQIHLGELPWNQERYDHAQGVDVEFLNMVVYQWKSTIFGDVLEHGKGLGLVQKRVLDVLLLCLDQLRVELGLECAAHLLEFQVLR